MKAAQKIGGIVVDEEGNPVEGVDVRLTIFPDTFYKTSPNLVTYADTTSDANGRWSFFQLPTSARTPSLTLKKEGYLLSTIYDMPAARLNPDAQGEFHEKIVIEYGYAFSGRVVDEAAVPIEDVSVTMGTKFDIHTATVRTDKDGNFRFENRRLSDVELLTLFVPGKAPQLLLVAVGSKDEPVEIVMTPGRKLTFEVTDSAGQPLKDVEFRVTGIDGLPGRHTHTNMPFLQGNKTDENGQIVWDDAPDSLCNITCRLRGYSGLELHVEPNQEKVSVTLYRSLVKLHVLDDETGEPIPAFTMTTFAYGEADDERPNSRWDLKQGTGGAMETEMYGGEYLAYRFDIQALGYEAISSRKVAVGEEDVELEIRLKKAAETATIVVTDNQTPAIPLFPLSGGTILTPDGANAAAASIEVSVKDHLLICGPRAKPVHSDSEGKFLLSDEQHRMIGPQEFTLTITHATGCAVIDGKDFRDKYDRETNANAEPIRLTAWGRIEGTLQVGDRKLEGTRVSIRWVKPESLSVGASFYGNTTTKRDGRFVFEQVMPGTISFTRRIPGNDLNSAWSSFSGTVEVKPGETAVCTIGGTGRAVIGKAVASEALDFSQFTARIVPKPENLADLVSPELPKEYWPDPWANDESCSIRLLAWYQTDEGKEYLELHERNDKAVHNLRFCELKKDGTFRFDDLPAGDYALVISETNNCGMDFTSGQWHHRSTFTVNDIDDSLPLDLGERD
ncbi:MAG: hypothetical protein FWD31_03095, partial [Planctomycetaceae bacterium]|nr:hypothetical protein [Planctomycetaceae bacterium]